MHRSLEVNALSIAETMGRDDRRVVGLPEGRPIESPSGKFAPFRVFRWVAYISLADANMLLPGRLVMNIAGFPSLDETQERLPRETPALDVGRVERAESIKNAIAITAMEGGRPSAFCLDLLALYEAGDISGAEMRKRMLEKARS